MRYACLLPGLSKALELGAQCADVLGATDMQHAQSYFVHLSHGLPKEHPASKPKCFPEDGPNMGPLEVEPGYVVISLSSQRVKRNRVLTAIKREESPL